MLMAVDGTIDRHREHGRHCAIDLVSFCFCARQIAVDSCIAHVKGSLHEVTFVLFEDGVYSAWQVYCWLSTEESLHEQKQNEFHCSKCIS